MSDQNHPIHVAGHSSPKSTVRSVLVRHTNPGELSATALIRSKLAAKSAMTGESIGPLMIPREMLSQAGGLKEWAYTCGFDDAKEQRLLKMLAYHDMHRETE